MNIRHDNPVLFADLHAMALTYYVIVPPAVNGRAGVLFIADHFQNHTLSPKIYLSDTIPRRIHSFCGFILHRRGNLLLIQLLCSLCYGHPAADHGEDTADDFSGRRVDNQVILPLRVLYIAVQRTRPQVLTFLRPEPSGAARFAGQVPAIKVVKQRLEGSVQAVDIFGPDAVNAIVHGNKADP